MSELTEVPVKDIAAIKKATVLDLSNNQLTSLPASFCSLTHLVELDLSKNMLRELPESFGSLTNLKRLDLYGNQLTHLPLSFCNLKSLRWLDLKNNPLVPMLAEIAGPCGDLQQCQQCARKVVATLTQTAIKVEEDRKRLLQEKLKEQEQLEQQYLMKKKELDAESSKKTKKKMNKKNKNEKQLADSHNKPIISVTDSNFSEQSATKQKGKLEDKEKIPSTPSHFVVRFFKILLRLLFITTIILTILIVISITFAVYDRKLFVQITEEYGLISKDVASYVLYFAKHVEYAAKHPTVKEMRSQLTACLRSIIASILNIYKTICQEFPVYYDVLKSKFKF